MLYTFEIPFYKRFKKKKKYYNEQGKEVGIVSRFYKNKLQSILDFVLDGFFLNFKFEDKDNQYKIIAEHRAFSIRDKWDIYDGENTYLLECKTKIKTNPRFTFKYGGKEYLIFKEYADKFIRIKDVETNKLISEWEYITLVPPRKVNIKILEDTMNIHLIMCLFLLLTFKYQ